MKDRLEKYTFLLLLIVITAAFVWVLNPFFSPIFWSIVLVLMFYPTHEKICSLLNGRRTLASLISLLICIVSILIPVTIVITLLARRIKILYENFRDNGSGVESYIDKIVDSFPAAENLLDRFGVTRAEIESAAEQSLSRVGEFVAQHTIPVGQNTLLFFIYFGLMIYLSFFLLRDGRRIIERMLLALPLSEEKERLLMSKFYTMVHATIKGNFVIAVVQGSLGGMFLWLIGIPFVFLWTTTMIIASLIPVIGSGIVWVPVAIHLILSGEYLKGISLIVFGVVIIGLVDNILRPILVGRDTQLPDYVVLFSTIGGIALFGVDGFVIGPLVAALFVVLWQIFTDEFNAKPNGNGT